MLNINKVISNFLIFNKPNFVPHKKNQIENEKYTTILYKPIVCVGISIEVEKIIGRILN